MKPLFLLPALLCAVMFLRAQTPAGEASSAQGPVKPELPAGPLLRSAPDFARWEVSFTYAEEKKKDGGSTTKSRAPGANTRLLKTVTTKTGRVIHEEQTNAQDQVTDTWFNGPVQYVKSAAGPTWFQSDNLTVGGALADGGYHPMPANGFRTLDWINEGNYAGTVPYGKSTCLIFVPGGYRQLDLRGDAEQRQKRMEAVNEIAYIDADTRLPIAVRSGAELQTYHFEQPPTAMQSLPADLADQIKKGAEARARLEQPAARPY